MPAQNKLVRKYFKDSFDGTPPDVSAVKISAILVNTHRDFNIKPKVSAQVDIPGIHLKPLTPLPEELQRIYDNSKDVIYFSLGSYKLSEMPVEKLNAFFEAFGSLEARVFMQYDETLRPANTPNNVYMTNWFPQNDVLGKSKVILFITNGGTLSYQEAIKQRCPMLVIPFTGEQYRNAMRVEKEKNGAMILFDDIDAKSLTDKIKELTTGSEVLKKAKEVQQAFTGSAVEPMKEAIFWIENVIKNQGSSRLETDLSCIQRLGLDVAAFYIGILTFCISFWVFSITLIVRRYRKKQERGKFKYY